MKKIVSVFIALSCGMLFADRVFSLAEDEEISGGEIVVNTTYNLEGHTLTLAAPLVVSGGATLTVADSTGTGVLDYTGRKGYAVIVKDGALILESGTIKSASGSGVIYLASSTSSPKFTMNGGKVLATSTGTEAAAILAGFKDNDNAIVEINGGEISGLVGIAVAGRNQVMLKDGVKIANTVVDSAEPTHWGIAFAGGNLVALAASGNILVGGEGALGRDEKVEAVVGSGLKTGHYSSAPLALAIANGYAAKQTNAVEGYPWELVKEVEEHTVTMDGEEVKVEIPKSYLVEHELVGKPEPEVQEFLETKDENGVANWQRSQLGLSASGELAVSAIDGENQTTANVVLSKVKTIESNGKLEITYSLHLNDKEGEVLATRAEPSFTVDLSELSPEKPVEKWVVTANFTASTNSEDEAISISQVVQSVNEVGAVRVDNAGSSVLLATPWVRVKDDGTHDSLAVKDMVDAVTLSPGDTLNVYNQDGTYSVFELDVNKEWKGVPMVDGDGRFFTPNPNAPVNPGQAVWLNRVGDTGKPIYLLGQVEAQSATSIKPEQATAEKREVATILGNPHPEATVIPATVESTGEVAKDELLVVKGEIFRRYVRNDAGELGYYETDARGKLKFIKVDEVTIPAGEAFWYQSRGGTIEIPVGQDR